jgi:hypothetical protein
VFDNVKAAIATEVVLAYPDFSKSYEFYTDASATQLVALIAQDGRPITFLSKNYPKHSKNTVLPKLNSWP